MSKDLLPRQRSNLREAVLFVFWVHSLDLLARWRSKDLDNLNKLVNAALARENGLPQHELSDDAADGPDVDRCCIV